MNPLNLSFAFPFVRNRFAKSPASSKTLQNEVNKLCKELHAGDSDKRKQIVGQLREIKDKQLELILTEGTTRLSSEYRQWEEELARKKRQRDRDIYRKHTENYLYSPWIEKIISAKSHSGSGSPVRSLHEETESDKASAEIEEARRIGIEEARAVRKRKREIFREVQREETTGIRRPRDIVEPIMRWDKIYRARKKKIDIRV